MSKNYKDITLALAGIFQASSLVHDVANNYTINEEALLCSINSLFTISPQDTLDVYGDVKQLRYGLSQLLKAFSKKSTKEVLQVTRYSVSLLHIEKLLRRNPDMLSYIGSEIEKIAVKKEYFSTTHNNVLHALADLYQNTISTFKLKVYIVGKQNVLNTPDNTAKCRALLLAGVRSAILWHQVGGTRLQLIFSRKRLFATANELIS